MRQRWRGAEAAWRHVLEELVARGLNAPELLTVEGGKGPEAALPRVWNDLPVQRCIVHKERNLLTHVPKKLHDEADHTVPARSSSPIPSPQ